MLSFSLDRLRVPCHDTQDNSVTDLALRKGRRLIHRGYVWGGGGGDGVDGIPDDDGICKRRRSENVYTAKLVHLQRVLRVADRAPVPMTQQQRWIKHNKTKSVSSQTQNSNMLKAHELSTVLC